MPELTGYNQHIYKFGGEAGLGGPFEPSVMGGKGCGLLQMSAMRLPVPPGFVVPVGYAKTDPAEFNEALDWLMTQCSRVSVRSGAPVSMPGMMDTVLNLRGRTDIHQAIRKIIKSAQSERALAYKKAHGLPADMGTAVIVQAMVYGDKDQDSGTGVTFTRNPSTGKRGLFGEWLPQATGEVLVSGLKTPKQIRSMPRHWRAQLDILADRLERHYRDMQDIEWTVESGKLWLLQTRTGKRTAKAAVRIALDMVNEGLVTAKEALARVTPEQVRQLDVERLPDKLNCETLARGMPVVPGVVTGYPHGRVYYKNLPDKAAKGILYTPFTEPIDYPLMQCVAGFITQQGGATSHAAVVARELGKPCIVGVGEVAMPVGALVTMCGTSGKVVKGEHRTVRAPERALYERLVRLAAKEVK